MEKVELYKSLKKEHQENERLCKENQSLLPSSSCDRDYQDAALEANRSLEDIVKQLYRELGTLQKIVGTPRFATPKCIPGQGLKSCLQ